MKILLLAAFVAMSCASGQTAVSEREKPYVLKYHWIRAQHMGENAWRFTLKAMWELSKAHEMAGLAKVELIGPSLRIPISLEAFDDTKPFEAFVEFVLPAEQAKNCSVRVRFTGTRLGSTWVGEREVTVALADVIEEAKQIEASLNRQKNRGLQAPPDSPPAPDQ